MSPAQVGDLLEDAVLDNGAKVFDELRAETIARTEMGEALNGAAIDSYRDAGIGMVEVIDGDGDEACAAVNGRTFPKDDLPDMLANTNCTRDFVPVL